MITGGAGVVLLSAIGAATSDPFSLDVVGAPGGYFVGSIVTAIPAGGSLQVTGEVLTPAGWSNVATLTAQTAVGGVGLYVPAPGPLASLGRLRWTYSGAGPATFTAILATR